MDTKNTSAIHRIVGAIHGSDRSDITGGGAVPLHAIQTIPQDTDTIDIGSPDASSPGRCLTRSIYPGAARAPATDSIVATALAVDAHAAIAFATYGKAAIRPSEDAISTRG